MAADRSGTTDMTVGKESRVLLAFAIPVFFSQLFQQLYNTADSLIVGNFLDKQALAAVSSSGSLIMLLIGFFNGFATGAGVIISRYFGANNEQKVRIAIHTNITVSLLSGVFLSAVGVLFTPEILKWMGTAADVLPKSVEYFRWYFSGVIATVMYNCLKGIMTALGDSKRPLYYLIFSSVTNVILDLLFVGVLHGGVGAAALATVISQALSVILCLIRLTRKGHIYTVTFKELGVNTRLLREIVRVGLPMGIQHSLISFANVLVQTNINSFGSDAMAACGSYSKIEGFAFLPVTCFSMGLTTFIGQNLGAGKTDRAKRGAKFGILTGIAMAEMIGLLIFFLGPRFIGLFNADPEVIRIGTLQCRTESLFYFALAFSHCSSGILYGADKGFVPMFSMMGVWCAFRICYITLAMKINHSIGLLFTAYPLTWSITMCIFALYLLKGSWLKQKTPQG